ncbi:MAG: glycosyltransferase family 39 protein [Terriglobales bacterium]
MNTLKSIEPTTKAADSQTPAIAPGQLVLVQEAPPPQPARRATLFLMVASALAIRLIVMGFMYQQQLNPVRDHFKFGFEAGRIAQSIALGRGFGSPLFTPTGPTAWMTPIYPYILAGFFKVFGIYTKPAAIAILSFQSLISALTCLPIFFFARRGFGSYVAKCAGWAWAFFPYAIYFPIDRIWETWLATLLFSLLFLIALKLENTDRISAWIGAGLLWGLSALNSAVGLMVLPFLHLRISYLLHKQGRRWLLPNVAFALAFIAITCPWFIRNWRTFHIFIPFRDNIGIVLRMGTKRSTDYWEPSELGPWSSSAEWQEFQRDGELKYMATKKVQAIQFIKANPGWYLRTSLRRVVFIWTGYWSLDKSYLKLEEWDPENIVFSSAFTILTLFGLRKAWRRRRDAAIPYIIVLLIFPLIYYFTSPEFYYRRPLDPIMLVLAVYALIPARRLDEPPSISANPDYRLQTINTNKKEDAFESELPDPV